MEFHGCWPGVPGGFVVKLMKVWNKKALWMTHLELKTIIHYFLQFNLPPGVFRKKVKNEVTGRKK